MIEFNDNEYIEINNPGKHNYIPIRILNKIENGYNAIFLPNSKEVKIYDYQLINYGYKKFGSPKNYLMIWVLKRINLFIL